MTKTQVKSIEKIWKDEVYTVLELSKYANYSAMLFEAGLLPAEDVINSRKINFVNKLVHIKGEGQCLRLLRTQHYTTPSKGLMAEVNQLTEKYELPDVGVHYCRKEVIDATIMQP